MLRNIDLFLHEFIREFTKDNIDDLVQFVRKFSVREQTEENDTSTNSGLARRMSRMTSMSMKKDTFDFELSKYLREKDLWAKKLKQKWENKGYWSSEWEWAL